MKTLPGFCFDKIAFELTAVKVDKRQSSSYFSLNLFKVFTKIDILYNKFQHIHHFSHCIKNIIFVSPIIDHLKQNSLPSMYCKISKIHNI